MSKQITKIVGGNVYTPAGVKKDATLVIEGNKIAEISLSPIEIDGAEVIDAQGANIVPGGLEMHIHGGNGRDYMEGTEDAFRIAVDAHLHHGTTSIFPTLSSSSPEMIMRAARTAEKLMAEPDSPILGIHLEGPYFNMKKAGAQMPEYITPPVPKDYEYILDNTSSIKRWDCAPELPGTEAFGRCLLEHGVVGAIAHTAAEYEDVRRAFDAGITHATHFYNAMSGMHNVREFKHEGTIESVYAIPEMTVECIADGIHVPAPILKAVYVIKGVDRMALITDALACSAGVEGGCFDPRVIIEDGVCKLADRSALAGSVATMDRLIQTAVKKVGIPFADAIRMTSETPATIMHVQDRKGSLVPGKDADICFYDNDCNLLKIIQMGKVID